jgi:hypothetical protein
VVQKLPAGQWEEHRTLFLDADFPVRRIISDNPLVRNPHLLYLAINLKWSTRTTIVKQVRSILKSKAQSLKLPKGKARMHGDFILTPGTEIRPSVYDGYIFFLKNVYAPNCPSGPIDLWRFAKPFQGKSELSALHLDQEETDNHPLDPMLYISVTRYCRKVELLCESVARGEFPGRAPKRVDGK